MRSTSYIFLTAALFAAVSFCKADTLLDKARSGDVDGQFQLGGEYFYGKNRKQNLPLALYWFRRAAIGGNPAAQYNLALCMLRGWGMEKNPAGAFYFLEKAMSGGVTKAAVPYAELLLSGVESGRFDDKKLPEIKADPQKAAEILRRAADSNDSDAILLLARHLFSDAVKNGREIRLLLKKYTEITRKPDPEALVIYAACLRSGWGGFAPDAAAGAKILKQAAELKHPEGTAQLAEMYLMGFGVKSDQATAMKLYDSAIKLGSPRAMTDIGRLKLAGFAVEHDPAGAFELFSKAAEKKYSPAQRMLGECYAAGIGTEKDFPKAIEYFWLAAKAGDEKAAFTLGEYYRDGKELAKDEAMAFYCFQLAARAGHPGALREVGKALIDGRGVKADHAAGLKFLRLASEAGDREAMRIRAAISGAGASFQ